MQHGAGVSRGWVVTLAALGINLVLGVLYAWSVMGKALALEWGWSKTQTALPFTVATAAFALMMIFAGRLQDRIGPRIVTTLGGLILGAGLTASAFVRTPAAMVLTFGIIGGIGIGLGYSATTPPAIKWFPPARKGLITGLVVSGVGIAAVYISPLTQYLLKAHGIATTFLALGLGAAVLVAVLSQLVSNPPPGYQPSNGNSGVPNGDWASADAIAHPNLDWHQMLRTPQFYQLWVMFVLGASAGLMIIAHVAMIAAEQARWAWGFVPVATLAVFNTVGRILGGALSDRMGRTQTMILAYGLQALNMFLFAKYTTPALLIFGSAFTGLCYGTIFTLMPAATADFYGVKNLGVNYGTLFTAFGVAGMMGPVLGGTIRDASGSWSYSFVASGVLLLAGAALAATIRPPARAPIASRVELAPAASKVSE
ncbi:MAG TPA: OFA family MFS transporter [Verrucomicrobiota bacterium]|jgi:OFA family oxalate/formate antiporter-like MFS transporter|nr:OFA family MFS transporter [Verrucomicrobiota bacterium]